MKFCKYCGTQVEDGTKICPHCDKELPVKKPIEISQDSFHHHSSQNKP